MRNLAFVMAVVFLGSFAIGRVGSLTEHRGFAGSLAWAQEADDQADDAVSQDDAASQADDASQDEDAASQADAAPQDEADERNASTCKKAGPAGGIYSGTVMDNNMGAGKIMAALSQCRTKLNGVWQDTFVPPAFWNGTINSNGAIKATMNFHLGSKCGYLFNGVFEHGNEISGEYKLSGCKGKAADGGTFDMTK